MTDSKSKIINKWVEIAMAEFIVETTGFYNTRPRFCH